MLAIGFTNICSEILEHILGYSFSTFRKKTNQILALFNVLRVFTYINRESIKQCLGLGLS